VPSEGLLRKLAYLAATGNEAVLLPFTLSGGTKAEAERLRRERDFENFARMVLASRERVEEFTKKLELLDQASAEALVESEEKLRKAKDDLQRLRDRAYELTTPEGGAMKVYRDGSAVRDDGGAQVDPLLIKPEDIPEQCPKWEDRKAAGEHVTELEIRRDRILEYRNKIEHAEKRVKAGGISEKELNDMEAALDRNMPDEVRLHYKPDERRAKPVERSLGSVADEYVGEALKASADPVAEFTAAASNVKREPKPEDLKPPVPSASTPAPM
jgi:hypothetical protein